MRLIDADALMKAIKSFRWCGVPNTLRLMFEYLNIIISQQPTIEAEPVKHGRWEFDAVEMEYFCSECGQNAPIGMSSYILHTYCPNCGAKMDLEKGDGK